MGDAENMFQPAQAAQKGPMVRLRSWFFTGLLVTAPVLLTIYITWLFIDIIDAKTKLLIWQGKGYGGINEYSKNRDERIALFVTEILNKYPPEPSGN